LLEANNEEALDEWRATQGEPVTPATRMKEHMARVNAQVQLEDFLN
jgi:hypothetical protein